MACGEFRSDILSFKDNLLEVNISNLSLSRHRLYALLVNIYFYAH